MFPIACSSKLGSVGRDFCLFFVLKPTSMLLPLKSPKLVSFLLQLINYLTCSTMFLLWLVCILHSLFLHLNNYDAETSIKCIVQGHEENSNRKPVFNKSVSIKRLSESVNIATVKRLLLKSETEMDFADLLFLLA